VGSSSSSTVGRALLAGVLLARRLAAAEAAERGVERHVADAERVARAVELRLERPAAERAEPLLRLAVGGQRIGLVQPRLEPLELAVQPPDLAERGAQQPVDGQPGARRLLRQVADPVTRPEHDVAALWSVDARQQAQQRRLAGPVGADEADAPRAGQGQAQPVEDGDVAIRGVQVGCREHE
jgi:hypothetical protein